MVATRLSLNPDFTLPGVTNRVHHQVGYDPLNLRAVCHYSWQIRRDVDQKRKTPGFHLRAQSFHFVHYQFANFDR
jgi:hypothetical protein